MIQGPTWHITRRVEDVDHGVYCPCGHPAAWYLVDYTDWDNDREVCVDCLEDFVLLKVLEG